MTLVANPFDLLPANLFNLFSTQGYANLQRHYMAILLRIYALAEFNRFGLAREVVLAEIVDYLKIEGALAEVAAQVDSETPSQSDAAGECIQAHTASLTGQQSENDYAAYLLRRLDENGWIEREQHADYSETIILPDYAFTLLEAFRNIQEQKPHEFTGQLYTAHQLVTASQTNKDFSPSLAVTQAYENVRQVVRGLSELNHNIRRYIERTTRGKDTAELLHLQFDDYAKTLRPTYHALKTSDHVSRYRQDIISQFQAWQMDGEWLDGAAEDMAMHSRLSPAQAGMEISHYLQFVVHQLESLDPLLEDIDHRHMQYLRTSLRQIRYQLVNADGSFKDRLASLAQGLASLKDEDLAELPDDAPAPRQHPVQEPDLHSYFTPPQRRAPFTPAEVVAYVLYPAELAEMHAATLQDVTQALTPGRVNRAVMSCFNGHKKLHLSELHPALLSDLHWLTTIIAYAHHPEVAYGLEMAEGEPVEVHSFRIAPFHLVKLTNGSA